jgi:hypothetical protein
MRMTLETPELDSRFWHNLWSKFIDNVSIKSFINRNYNKKLILQKSAENFIILNQNLFDIYTDTKSKSKFNTLNYFS